MVRVVMIVNGPMSVHCVSCNARPGQKCFSKNGNVMRRSHETRIKKARELRKGVGK